MKRVHQYIRTLAIGLLLMAGLLSCEKIIDISIPDQERKIVVNGLVSPDQPVRVNLSRSLSILETDNYYYLSGADVRLFSGAELLGKFREDSTGYYTLPDFKPQADHAYRLTASYGGLKPVEATAVLPAPVPVTSVDTVTVTGEWGQQELRLAVKFNDPPGIDNVYSCGVDATYKEIDYRTMEYTGRMLSQTVYLYGTDERFMKDEAHYYEGKLFFEDLLFDGMTKTVEFGISGHNYYDSDTIWLNIRMGQIDPTYYRYALSNEAYQNANSNPFAEPVQVYTNVTGGYGIFAGSSSSEFQLIIRGSGKGKK